MVGDLNLIDAETGAEREISISPALLRRYEQAVTDFCEDIEQFSHRYGINYIRTITSENFEDIILTYLRRRGMVK
ncbi:MAG TPA: hypothetical protein PKV43_11675 [Armatimonadota bacterium]|nr:hypothetical protein [Armatimonadota bacterium]